MIWGTQVNGFCKIKSFFRDFSTRPNDQDMHSVNSTFLIFELDLFFLKIKKNFFAEG